MRETTLCENSSKLTNHIGIYPQCYDGKKEYEVTVIYNDVEQDILYLCERCMQNLKRDCRKHRYRVRVEKAY